MKNFNYWPIAIKSMITVICFTLVAITFNKWWIVLFALLFGESFQTRTHHFVICDRCGTKSAHADDPSTARQNAIEAGWITFMQNGKRLDYCPECKKDIPR